MIILSQLFHNNYRIKHPAIIYSFLALILGLSCGLAFPPYSYSILIIITIALFIQGLNSPCIKNKFMFGYVFYLGAGISFIGSWFSYYFRDQLDCSYTISYLLTLCICLYAATYIGLISSIYQRIKTSSAWFNAIFLFPSLWVSSELIRGTFFPRSWYALGYTQVNNLIFRGYYPLFGVYFVSWLIVALAGLCAYSLNRCVDPHLKLNPTKSSLGRNSARIKLFSFLIALSLFGGIFCGISYLLSQLKYTQVAGKAITVALLQPSVFSTKNYSYADRDNIEIISKELVINNNAELLVLPETVFGTIYKYLSPGFLEQLSTIAASKPATLIVGVTLINEVTGEKYTGDVTSSAWNKAIYIKRNLVPFGEYNPLKDTIFNWLIAAQESMITSYTPGPKAQKPFTFKDQQIAFNICYENTINDFVADNAQGATILLNQSDLSWYGQTTMKNDFLQFSQARALENQKYFLQDGNTGDTAIINPSGVIEVKIPPFIPGAAIGKVQGYRGQTPFARWKNWPLIFLCLVNIIIALKSKNSNQK